VVCQRAQLQRLVEADQRRHAQNLGARPDV
jgi:hypothetical protein